MNLDMSIDKELLASAERCLADAQKELDLQRYESGKWENYIGLLWDCLWAGQLTDDQYFALLEARLLDDPTAKDKHGLKELMPSLQKEADKIGPVDPKFDHKAFSDDLLERSSRTSTNEPKTPWREQ